MILKKKLKCGKSRELTCSLKERRPKDPRLIPALISVRISDEDRKLGPLLVIINLRQDLVDLLGCRA